MKRFELAAKYNTHDTFEYKMAFKVQNLCLTYYTRENGKSGNSDLLKITDNGKLQNTGTSFLKSKTPASQ